MDEEDTAVCLIMNDERTGRKGYSIATLLLLGSGRVKDGLNGFVQHGVELGV